MGEIFSEKYQITFLAITWPTSRSPLKQIFINETIPTEEHSLTLSKGYCISPLYL
jgi:hypothetical protein